MSGPLPDLAATTNHTDDLNVTAACSLRWLAVTRHPVDYHRARLPRVIKAALLGEARIRMTSYLHHSNNSNISSRVSNIPVPAVNGSVDSGEQYPAVSAGQSTAAASSSRGQLTMRAAPTDGLSSATGTKWWRPRDVSGCLQDAEVQSRGRNASCKRPFTHCEGRVPKAEGPEEDRDEVLNPAMERRKTASSRRNMGGCCVVEDTDQQVDHEEKPKCAEKAPYISGSSAICCAARADELRRHLSSPLCGRWKWCG